MSTIMKALRKVEDQKKAEANASQPGELERQIVQDAELPRKNPPKRVAVIVGAVVLSGLAGVGMTLGALSLLQTNGDGVATASEAPGLIAAGQAAVVAVPDERNEGTTVVVAQDVLNNISNSNKNNARAGGIEIVAGSQNGKDVIVVNAASASEAPGDASATPPLVTEPAPARIIEDPAAIARLKARREARFSRMPRKTAQAATATPSGEEPIAKIVTATADVTPARAPVMAVNIPDETTDTVVRHQRAETKAIEGELAAVTPMRIGVAEPHNIVREEVEVVQPQVVSSVISKLDEQMIDHEVSQDSHRVVVESSDNEFVELEVEVEAEVEAGESVSDDVMSPASSLPEANTNEVPRFAISGTTWHPYRQRRTADISVETAGGTRTVEVREGEMFGSMKVSEIGPTSITFLHEGKVIKRRIGAGLR
ncbi:MAG: hypothetical protein QMC73_10955 [Myxococcota bacterium]